MIEDDGERVAAAVLVVVAVLLVLGALLDDPLAVGSTDFYTLTAMGLGFGAWRGLEVEARRPALFAGVAAAIGGLLLGIGTLPLSHPVADPWVVRGQTVSEGGFVSVVGFVLFLASLLTPLYVRDAPGSE